MRVLALDTTTVAGSAALLVDDRIVAERASDPGRSYAEQLPAGLLELLESCGVSIREIDAFAVATGPGSFTGLRIGIATIQGLAFVGQRPVAGVSALDAIAHAVSGTSGPGTIVAAWMDAQRAEVFAAAYRVEDRPPYDPLRIVPLDEARVGTADAVLERWTAERIARPDIVAGAGAVRYAGAVEGRLPGVRVVGAPVLAGVIGRLGAARVRAGGADGPSGVRPLYVRRPDAELARDARR